MESDILTALQNINDSQRELIQSIKVIGGLLFGALLFVHFGRFMRW